MALHLKTFGHDAIAVSYDWNGDEVLDMLYDWADKIIVMRNKFLDRVPSKYSDKIVMCDVGEDIWGNPLHPELQRYCLDHIEVNGWHKRE